MSSHIFSPQNDKDDDANDSDGRNDTHYHPNDEASVVSARLFCLEDKVGEMVAVALVKIVFSVVHAAFRRPVCVFPEHTDELCCVMSMF